MSFGFFAWNCRTTAVGSKRPATAPSLFEYGP